MFNIQRNQEAGRNADRKTREVDPGVNALLEEAAKGYFQVVLQHGFLVKMSTRFEKSWQIKHFRMEMRLSDWPDQRLIPRVSGETVIFAAGYNLCSN
jgi:hypothetical protein